MRTLWTDYGWIHIAVAGAAGLLLCQVNLYLTSAVLHRGICHGAFVYPRRLKRFVAFWLWLTAFIPPLTWVAVHLHHHKNSDTPNDPHSPIYMGFWHVTLLTWYYVPSYARSNWDYVQSRYLRAHRDERLLHFLDKPRVSNSNFYGQLILSLALGPAVFAFWVGRTVPYMLLSGCVNSIGHTHGERKYNNQGTNAKGFFQHVFSYIVGGETLGHNYHHCFPKSGTFNPSSFDPGFWFACKILRGRPVNAR